MVYSDSSTLQGIVEETRWLTGTDATSYSINNLTRNANRALDRVAYLIQTADGEWDFDDTNNTDLAIATTDIVSGQQDYGISTAFLKVSKVFIYQTATDTTWQELEFVGDKGEFLKASSTNDTGVPTKYTIINNSIFFDTFPNYNSTGGLKVCYQRNMGYFATSDTTKTPGFNPQYHRLISLLSARDFFMAKEPKKTNQFAVEIDKLEKGLVDFYSNRKQEVALNFSSNININDYR